MTLKVRGIQTYSIDFSIFTGEVELSLVDFVLADIELRKFSLAAGLRAYFWSVFDSFSEFLLVNIDQRVVVEDMLALKTFYYSVS